EKGDGANSFAHPTACESSIRADRATPPGAVRCCCRARADDDTSSKKRDRTHHRIARPAAEASGPNEENAAADRFASDEDTCDPCHPDTSTGIATAAANRSNPNADRKSTRLNSSHLVISYAVFCLKKKSYTQ